jgi:hypothetical protein
MLSINLYSRRILSVFLWLLLSISSLRGWNYLDTSLAPGEKQIWLSHDSASLLAGSWVLFAVVAIGLSMLYIYELKYCKPERLTHVIFWVAIIGLPAIYVYPFGSNDHFAYIAYAHLHAQYGLNPYQDTVSGINNYLSDPFLKNMWWIHVSSVYGPLWTWMSYALYRLLTGFGLIPLIFGFKILGLLMHILITTVVYRLSEVINAGRGSKAALLYGLNPLAIFELVCNAHNDGLAVLLLLISLLLILKTRYISGFVIAGMSAACKLTTGIAMPFLIWKTAKEKNIWYARICTGVAVSIISVMYLALLNGSWEGVLNGLRNPLQGLISNSLVSIPYALGYDHLIIPVRIMGLLIFGFLYISFLKKSQIVNNESLLILIGLGFVAYYLFGAYVVHRWYFLWPLAIMAAVPDNPWTKVIIGQSSLMLISYSLFLVFGEEIITIALTYLLTLVPILLIGITKKKSLSF